MENLLDKYHATAKFLIEKFGDGSRIGIILGSGLGPLANQIEEAKMLKYSQIPGFPVSTVQGHDGMLISGFLGGKKVLVMKGRFHYYEGYPMETVTFPVRVMKLMGINTLIVSNAAGGLNLDFKPGDIMFITDHINFFSQNPLIGPNIDAIGTRFPDMGKTYNPELVAKAKSVAKELGIGYKTGIYIGSSGPTLETPAEYRLFRSFGADATGMSTVPEVIVAHHAGIKCFGVSVITNASVPEDPDKETTHDEVQDVAGKAAPKLAQLVEALIREI